MTSYDFYFHISLHKCIAEVRLELAIWKARMDDDELDADARRASRERCGNDLNVIVPGVLLYLK